MTVPKTNSSIRLLIAIYRAIFIVFLALIIFVFITQFNDFKIDTNLTDLAPQFAQQPETRAAVDHVSAGLEKRIVLMVENIGNDNSSGNTSIAEKVAESLSKQINSLKHISTTPDTQEILQRIVNLISPFRYQLLNEQQRQLLIHSDKQSISKGIAEQAYQQLFQLSSNPRLISFEEDPLGWHNAVILSYLSRITQPQNAQKSNQFIFFTLEKDKLSLEQQQGLHTKINHIITTIQQEHKIKIYRSGVFFFATEAANQSKKEISLITSISMVCVFALLILIFRNIGPVILPFISIALGVVFAIAITQMIFGAIHILTIVFGASLIGVVIDYSLHYFYHKSHTHESSNQHSHLVSALFLSLCTSLVGYAALSFSELITLKKVALFSCCGLAMAWLSVVCLGELMTKKMSPPRESLLSKFVESLFIPIRTINTKSILTIIVLVIIACTAILIFAAPVNDDPRLFFKPSAQLLNEEKKVGEQANDFEPGHYLLLKSSPNKSLHSIAKTFKKEINQAATLDHSQFISLTDWVPSIEQQAKNYQLQAQLFEDEGAIEQLFAKLNIKNTPQDNLIELQKFYSDAANKQLDLATTAQTLADMLPPLWLKHNEQELAFVLIKKGTDTNALESIVARQEGIEYINTLGATTQVLREQRQSASWLLFIAYCFISLLLLLRFKSLSALWMISVPLISSSLILLLFFLTNNTLNLFHIMAMFLVLGLGMDYSIFVKEMREKLSITHHSIFLSAITSILSFGLLAISSIPVVSAFGLTLLIGNLSNLIGAFIFSNQLSRYE